MKIAQVLILSLMLTVFLGCKKDEDSNSVIDQIIGEWTFAEKPTQNLNYFQGNIEDRTIFQGSELLTFSANGNFYIDLINYGHWELDSSKSIIFIELTYNNGYPPDGFPVNFMTFEIIKLTKSTMEVYHRYYKYYDNKYKLSKI